jgi:hypothetical protein
MLGWIQKLRMQFSAAHSLRKSSRLRFIPRLEQLEDRTVPSDLTVTNLSNGLNVVGSLPYEISIAKTG